LKHKQGTQFLSSLYYYVSVLIVYDNYYMNLLEKEQN